MSRYIVKRLGHADTDTFPYSVIDTSTGRIVNSYSHMQIADEVAHRINTGTTPASIYDVTEADEQMP